MFTKWKLRYMRLVKKQRSLGSPKATSATLGLVTTYICLIVDTYGPLHCCRGGGGYGFNLSRYIFLLCCFLKKVLPVFAEPSLPLCKSWFPSEASTMSFSMARALRLEKRTNLTLKTIFQTYTLKASGQPACQYSIIMPASFKILS